MCEGSGKTVIKFLFWNINRKPLEETIAKIIKHYNVDILILAESSIPEKQLRTNLSKKSGNVFNIHSSNCEKISIFSQFPKRFFSALVDSQRTTIQSIKLPLRPQLLLGAVHFPSQLHSTVADLHSESSVFMNEIIQAEMQVCHKNTIVVGDFNMNPFDSGMVAASGMNAVMTRRVAQKGFRTIRGRQFDFFYNPMWGHFGDREKNLGGTYYYDKGDYINYYWNMFDQVLFRSDILRYFNDQEVEILTSDGENTFLNSNKIPDKNSLSDHLPILFSLNI